MKRHILRFGWLYLTLFVLAAWPMVLWRRQAPPPLDVATIKRLVQIYQEGFIRAHPTFKVVTHDPAQGVHLVKIGDKEDTRLYRIANMLGPASMPALQPELDLVTKTYDPQLKRWDELTSQGCTTIFPVTQAADDRGVSPQVPNFLALQTLVKIRRVQAETAIREQRWTDALHLLESSANLVNPIRYQSLMATLIAIATRAIAYGGYATLLHAGPPPEVARAALDSLVALRASDPVFDDWVWRCERCYTIQNNYLNPHQAKAPDGRPLPNPYLDDPILRNAAMIQAVYNLVQVRERIRDPRLRAWADDFATRYGHGVPVEFYPSAVLLQSGIQWTTYPAVRKWLREMIAREPWCYHDAIIPEQEYRNLDPWTLLFFNGEAVAWANLDEAAMRARIAMTKGRLLEAAFAARLYKEKNDAWPADLKALTAFYPLPDDKATSAAIAQNHAVGTSPMLPLRLAERAVTDELKAELWNQYLPLKALTTYSGTNVKQGLAGDGALSYTEMGGKGEYLHEPVQLLAVQEALLAHPKLVETAQTFMGLNEKSPWEPLDAALARRITDQADRGNGLPPASGAAPTSATTGSTPKLNRIKLTAKLRAPEQAMVIWSPGPDGKDDGGMIAYDPTNGTISRGDLLLFGEEY